MPKNEMIDYVEAWEYLDFSDGILVQNIIASTFRDYPELIGDIFHRFRKELKDYKIVDFNKEHNSKFVESLLSKNESDYLLPVGGFTNHIMISPRTIGVSNYRFAVQAIVFLDTNIVSNMERLVKTGAKTTPLKDTINILNIIEQKGLNPAIYPYLIENMTKINNGYKKFEDINDNLVIAKSYLDEGLKGLAQNKYYDDKLIKVKHKKYPLNVKSVVQAKEINKQKMNFAILLKSFLIHKSSRKNTEKKLLDLVDFINKEIGFMPEYMFILMKGYFENKKELKPFLKIIDNVQVNKLKFISGMSWDLYVYDECSRLFTYGTSELCIPIFATLDKGLKCIIEYNPVRTAVIDGENNRVLLIHEKSLHNSIEFNSVLDLIESESIKRKEVGANIDNTINKTLENLIQEYNNFFINK